MRERCGGERVDDTRDRGRYLVEAFGREYNPKRVEDTPCELDCKYIVTAARMRFSAVLSQVLCAKPGLFLNLNLKTRVRSNSSASKNASATLRPR
jgi:hypothetical protein